MVLFLPSASGVATGDAQSAGVHYVAATEKHPPLRIYYPAENLGGSGKRVGYFQDTSAAFFLQGYWSVLMGRQRDTLVYKLGHALLQLVALVLPLHYLKVPNVYLNAPVSDITPKLPLILFSHGNTGTGQENSVLLSAWAKQGHVVVSVHHTDGSSCGVRLANGNELWYDPGPPFTNYDRNFRPKQMEVRVQELLAAREWLASCKDSEYQSKIDWDKTIVSGYSYGAATTALLAAKNLLPSLKAVILLDGWFFIDVKKSAGIEFENPKEAFDPSANSHLKKIPALFLNSSQFASWPKLWAATQKLATHFQAADPPHVLPHTTHHNFNDLVFWCPALLLQKVGATGASEPRQAYMDIVSMTTEFLKKQR